MPDFTNVITRERCPICRHPVGLIESDPKNKGKGLILKLNRKEVDIDICEEPNCGALYAREVREE